MRPSNCPQVQASQSVSAEQGLRRATGAGKRNGVWTKPDQREPHCVRAPTVSVGKGEGCAGDAIYRPLRSLRAREGRACASFRGEQHSRNIIGIYD